MTLFESNPLPATVFCSYEESYMQKQRRPVAVDQLVELIAEVLTEIVQSTAALGLKDANISVFTAKKLPSVSIKDYLARLAKFCYCSPEAFVLALIFIDRLTSFNKGFRLDSANVHRVLFVSIIVAIKYIDDKFYKNDYYAKVGGVSVAELNSMEKSFVFQLNFKLYVESETYFRKAAQNLVKESGIDLESEHLKKFRAEIKKGDWDKALEQIPSLNLPPEGQNEASFLIYEQKYLELIRQKRVLEALEVLRTNIKPFCENSEKLHKLASLIMCQSAEELHEKAGISGSEEDKRQLLINIRQKCKPETMIEPNRLETLLSQALTYQMVTCKFHSAALTENQPFSLIEQHKCVCEETPSICCKTLKDKDEVWNLKFSPDGEKIVSVCKKASLSVWELNMDNSNFVQNKYVLEKAHNAEINSINWSPDSTKIVTASSDKLIKIFNATNGHLINTLTGHKEAVFSAIWHPDNTRIISGGIDSDLIIWRENGEIISKIPNNRISELLISPNGKMLYCLCATLFKVSVFDLQRQVEIHKIMEKEDILSGQISSDGSFLLLNTSHKSPELHLWDLRTYEILMRYTGHSQEKFLIRCDFGGPNECFIVCGSEDSKVYIWHRNIQKPIKILAEHKAGVNAVSWNRKNPQILVSGSDDQNLKLWVAGKLKKTKDPKTFMKKVKNIVKSFFQSVEDKKSEAIEKAFEKERENEEIGPKEDLDENDG